MKTGSLGQVYRASKLSFLGACVLFATSFAVAQDHLLRELAADEGKNLVGPFELWVATFAPTEGSYGSGPRVLLITNAPERAIVNIHGRRRVLRLVAAKGTNKCEKGGTVEERFESTGIALQTKFTTSPGAEACWVQGTIIVTVGKQTQKVHVKGVSGY